MVLNRRAIKANARQFLTNGQWVHLFLAGIIIEAVNYINFGTSLFHAGSPDNTLRLKLQAAAATVQSETSCSTIR